MEEAAWLPGGLPKDLSLETLIAFLWRHTVAME